MPIISQLSTSFPCFSTHPPLNMFSHLLLLLSALSFLCISLLLFCFWCRSFHLFSYVSQTPDFLTKQSQELLVVGNKSQELIWSICSCSAFVVTVDGKSRHLIKCKELVIYSGLLKRLQAYLRWNFCMQDNNSLLCCNLLLFVLELVFEETCREKLCFIMQKH